MHGLDGGDESASDGLWTCRLNDTTGAEAFFPSGNNDDTPPLVRTSK